jgi:hypothetical protein
MSAKLEVVSERLVSDYEDAEDEMMATARIRFKRPEHLIHFKFRFM